MAGLGLMAQDFVYAGGDLAQTITGVKTFADGIVAPSIGPSSGQRHLLPAVNADTVALLAAPQTLAAKTLTTPTIADFTNAAHTHQNAAGGGALDAAAIGSGLLGVARGGTGISSYTVGDVLYASGAAALSGLADVAAGSYLRSGGVGAAPLWSTLILPNAATANQVVYATATNAWGGSANFMYDAVNDRLTLTSSTGGATDILITSNTNNPALRLRVGAGGAADPSIIFENAVGTAIHSISGNLAGAGLNMMATTQHRWTVGGSEKMTLTSTLLTVGAGIVSSAKFTTTGTGSLTGLTLASAESVGVATGAQVAFSSISGASNGLYFNSAGTNYSHTSGGIAFGLFASGFAPASGSGSWAMLHLNPTVNGTSTGTAYGLLVASKTNVLTGGAVKLLSLGTTTDSGFTGYTPLMELFASGNLQLNSAAGRHAFGTTSAADIFFLLGPSFTGSGAASPIGFKLNGNITGSVGSNMTGAHFEMNFVEAGSGAHGLLSNAVFYAGSVTVGGSTVGDTANVYISGAMAATVTGANYALWSDAGLNRFDGDGTHVFELPADATDPTGGGGAAAGRIPVLIGGATKYLAYY